MSNRDQDHSNDQHDSDEEGSESGDEEYEEEGNTSNDAGSGDEHTKHEDDTTKNNKIGEGGKRPFTGFFKRFGSKKSIDVDAKNESNTSSNAVVSKAENMESTDNQNGKIDVKTDGEEGRKQNTSFFSKIRFSRKTTSEESTNIEDKKQKEDEVSNSR